jgi:peptidylprolyl isomerase
MKRSRWLLFLGFNSLLISAPLLSLWPEPARGEENTDASVVATPDGGGLAVGSERVGDAGIAPGQVQPAVVVPTPPEAAVRREGNIYILPSGLRYVELRVGKGAATPAPGKRITVHYTGWFRSGKQFDSSRGHRPYSFVWGKGQVIRGYEEGMATMHVGGRRKLIIPPELAYGARGYKKIVPPNATLIFDVELLSVR